MFSCLVAVLESGRYIEGVLIGKGSMKDVLYSYLCCTVHKPHSVLAPNQTIDTVVLTIGTKKLGQSTCYGL